MSLENIKENLPNLHSLEVSSKELFSEEREVENLDIIPEKVELDRVKDFINRCQTLEALDELENSLSYELRLKAKEALANRYARLRLEQSNEGVTNFDRYLFRASSMGRIMGGVPKPLTPNQAKTYEDLKARHEGGGKPLTLKQVETLGDLNAKATAKVTLNDSAKKYLEELVWEALSGRSKSVSTKYMDKGIIGEESSITLYSNVTGKLLEKNKIRMVNKYFTGECDNSQGKIRDIKTSWEFSTFPIRENEIKDKLYEWQLDTYMHLWGLDEAELIYCLIDTPANLINDELTRLNWKFSIFDGNGDVRPEHIDLVVETVTNLIYSYEGLEQFCNASGTIKIEWFEGKFKEIPAEIRLKVFEQKYCRERSAMMEQMVVLAREYMNSLLEQMGESIIKLTSNKSE